MIPEDDELGKLLADGWDVCGYSVCMLAAGALSHHILLRKGSSLTTFGILQNGKNELTRGPSVLTPKPEAPVKKGFFG